MKRQITCIVCPNGCAMTAELQGDRIRVTGNSCARGEKHAIAECTHPVRSLTSTVRVSNRPGVMVSIKSAQPVPKEKLFEIMKKIRSSSVQAPVAIGTAVLTDICGTDMIATKEIN